MSVISPVAARPQIFAALENASARTGVDFDYLLQTAERESGLKTSAKAKTSSAAGLFQFIEETWLSTVKKHGAEFGLGAQAAAIEAGSDGRHKVSDPAVRQEILALRHDPKVSALMAGALTQDSADGLESGLGRAPRDGELYIAHFLGMGGAVRLIQAAETQPGQSAAALFPKAAAANKAVFYGSDGQPRSVAQVYQKLVDGPGSSSTTQMAYEDGLRGGYDLGGFSQSTVRSLAHVVGQYNAPGGSPSAFGRNSLQLSGPVLDILAAFDPLEELRSGSV